VAEFGDADIPDINKDLYDPVTGGKRPMTEAEINAFVIRPTLQMSKLQAKLALKAIGKLAAVKAYVASLPNDHNAVIAWQDAQSFKRESGLLVSAATALGFTDAQLDELFIAGAKIES
jgi:DNA transposition AAA+ family ATPase